VFEYTLTIKKELKNEYLALWFVKNIINPGFINEVILQNPSNETKYLLISLFREGLLTIWLKNSD